MEKLIIANFAGYLLVDVQWQFWHKLVMLYLYSEDLWIYN